MNSDSEVTAIEVQKTFAFNHGIKELYKFRPFSSTTDSERVAQILLEGKIHFSYKHQLNDPFDLYPRIDLGGSLDDPAYVSKLRTASAQVLERRMSRAEAAREVDLLEKDGFKLLINRANEVLDVNAKNYPIFSMAGNRTHPLLWSHYGGGHHGVCIHFLATEASIFGSAMQVTYHDDRARIPLPISDVPTIEVARRLLLWKGKQWSYEQEYRLIRLYGLPFQNFGARFDGQFMTFPLELICGVTLGIQMPPERRNSFLLMIKKRKPQLPVWLAKVGENFEPAFRPLNIVAMEIEATRAMSTHGLSASI